jgi:hypothetical protein
VLIFCISRTLARRIVKSVDIVSFAFGKRAAEPLPDETEKLCLWVAQQFLGPNANLVKRSARMVQPVDTETVNSRAYAIYTIFNDAVGQAERDAKCLIFDFATEPGLVRGTLYNHLAITIEAMIEEHPDDDRLFICLMPDLPDPKDKFWASVMPAVERGRLIFIGDDGSCVPTNRTPASFHDEDYRLRRSISHGDPLDMLKMKMVRKLGHFPLRSEGTTTQCARHYFDGRYCTSEIAELLNKYVNTKISQLATTSGQCRIMYESTDSPWCETAVRKFESLSGITCTPLDASPTEATKVISPSDSTNELLIIIVPFVGDGFTLSSTFAAVSERFPSVVPRIMAILSTQGDKDDNGSRTIGSGRSPVKIEYLLKVNQQRYRPNNCPLCSDGISHTEFEAKSQPMLTSYDFWDLVRAAGLKAEADVPEYRAAMERVPDFNRIVEANGPFLASKLSDLIELASDSPASGSVVVCPKEIGSRTIALYLRRVSGATVILVPREIINQYRKPHGLSSSVREDLLNSNASWAIQLRSVHSDVVVMDEFVGSGGTRKALTALLQAFGKSVFCYLSLVDFWPTTDSDRVPTFALYRWRSAAFSDVRGVSK